MDLWDDVESGTARTSTGEEAYAALGKHVPAGVASAFRAREPYPIVDRADGAARVRPVESVGSATRKWATERTSSANDADRRFMLT